VAFAVQSSFCFDAFEEQAHLSAQVAHQRKQALLALTLLAAKELEDAHKLGTQDDGKDQCSMEAAFDSQRRAREIGVALHVDDPGSLATLPNPAR
jgi:hypothetical protein